MRRKTLLLISAIVLFSGMAVSQGTDPPTGVPRIRDLGVIGPQRVGRLDSAEDFIVGEVRGTVKTKAGYLAKPEYPEKARLDGIEGSVRVRVSINEDGAVANAEAIEGDPALRGAAEEAARLSKFRIPRDANGQATKEEGFLTYSFEIGKAGWARIAYRLNGLERFPVSLLAIAPVMKAMSPEWTDERRMLKKLDDIGRAEPTYPNRPVFVRSQTTAPRRLPGGMTAQSSSISGTLSLPPLPGPEQIAISRELISALKIRLANDKLAAWEFDLGLGLNNAFQLSRNPAERANAAGMIQTLIENHPDGVPAEVLAALHDIIASIETTPTTRESLDASRKAIIVIMRSK